MIEFDFLYALLFLPLPVLVYFLVPRSEQQEAALYVPFYQDATQYEADSRGDKTAWFRRLLAILVWLLLIFAAAQPKYIGDPIELPITGRDLMMAVDISGSMGTEDMELFGRSSNRLDVVKNVVGDFVDRRTGDRLGLILFGSQAYLQTPLTFDRKTVKTLLQETPLGIAGGKTAIGDAIGLAVKRLQSRPADSRILILLTDGASNMGEVTPEQAARLAAQENITIHTIGFGAEVLRGFIFTQRNTELDEATLKDIAERTGGLYQRATNTTELRAVYDALDQLEPIDQEQETYRPEKSLYFWPLGIALTISLLMALLHPLAISGYLRIFDRFRPAPTLEPRTWN